MQRARLPTAMHKPSPSFLLSEMAAVTEAVITPDNSGIALRCCSNVGFTDLRVP